MGFGGGVGGVVGPMLSSLIREREGEVSMMETEYNKNMGPFVFMMHYYSATLLHCMEAEAELLSKTVKMRK